MLFNLHVYLSFPGILLLLVSNLISLWSENRYCTTSINLDLRRCVSWPRMWCTLVNDPCKLEKNVYFTPARWRSKRCSYSVYWWCCWVELCPYWLPACRICPFPRGVDVSDYSSGFIYTALLFYQLLPHIFWRSVIRSLHIKECQVFLENNFFIIMKCPLYFRWVSSLWRFLCLKLQLL